MGRHAAFLFGSAAFSVRDCCAAAVRLPVLPLFFNVSGVPCPNMQEIALSCKLRNMGKLIRFQRKILGTEASGFFRLGAAVWLPVLPLFFNASGFPIQHVGICFALQTQEHGEAHSFSGEVRAQGRAFLGRDCCASASPGAVFQCVRIPYHNMQEIALSCKLRNIGRLIRFQGG